MSSKFLNVLLVGGLGLVGLLVGMYFLFGSDRAVSAVYDTGLEKLEVGDIDSARLAFERALERSEDKAPPAYQLARLEARKDPKSALPHIRVAIAEGHPTGPMVAGMARIALNAHEVALAEELIQKLQQVDPANTDILPLRGGLAIAQHRMADAIGLFEELLSSGSASDEVKLTLGQLLSRSNRSIDRTRAKVILLDTIEGDGVAAKNAMLYILASGQVGMDARDWRKLFAVGMQKGFLDWPQIKENLPLLRRLMILCSRYAPTLAPEIANKRVAHPDAEAVDYIDAAMAAQRDRNLRRSQSLLDSVPENEQQSIGVRMLRANQRILEGRPDAGMIEMEQIIAENPDNLAALPLLRDLADSPEGMLSVREQISVLEMLTKHPYSSLEDRFGAYERILQLRPLSTKEIMQEVASTVGKQAPIEAAKWFLARGQPQYVTGLLTDEMARGNPGIYELRFVALLRQGAIDDAAAMLESRPASLPSILVHTCRLRLFMARDDIDAAREQWETILEMAESQGFLTYFPLLANMALEFNDSELALRAFRTGFDRGASFNERDWLRFSDLTGQHGDLAAQKGVADAAVKAFPDNPVFINNAAYLELLANENVRENLVRMEQLVDDYGDIDQFRVTLALAYFRNDRATMAIRTMDRIELDWTPKGARAQAIYLAALADGNQRGMAENFANNVDTSSLLPEEYDLIADLLQ